MISIIPKLIESGEVIVGSYINFQIFNLRIIILDHACAIYFIFSFRSQVVGCVLLFDPCFQSVLRQFSTQFDPAMRAACLGDSSCLYESREVLVDSRRL